MMTTGFSHNKTLHDNKIEHAICDVNAKYLNVAKYGTICKNMGHYGALFGNMGYMGFMGHLGSLLLFESVSTLLILWDKVFLKRPFQSFLHLLGLDHIATLMSPTQNCLAGTSKGNPTKLYD